MHRLRGIRARLTLAAVLLAAVTMSAAAYLLVSTLEHSLVSSSDELSRSRARDLVATAEAGLLPPVLADVGDDGVAQVSPTAGQCLPRRATFAATLPSRPSGRAPPRRRC